VKRIWLKLKGENNYLIFLFIYFPFSYLRWVGHIQTHGICVIKNVPIESNNCRKIAEIVAPIQPNLYGDVFEIINTPKPMNLALSNEKFMFHMDLPYLHDMPYIQFIQCLK
jgi:hypothetical protein